MDQIERGKLPNLQDRGAEYLQEVLEKMKDSSSGVSVKDRTYHLRVYKNCFVGKEAVDWMMANLKLKFRTEAVSIGQQLMKSGAFHHVVDQRDFEDEYYFFEFR